MRGASRDVTARKHAELAVRNLSGRLLSAQEEERRRIARELHDNLSQRIALLAIEIEQVGMKSEPLSAVAGSMQQLGLRAAEISTEIHNLSHQLHSAKLEALGLGAAVQGHCRELRAQGLQVHALPREYPMRCLTTWRSVCSASSRKG
jgi:signal transduction histidine kinase